MHILECEGRGEGVGGWGEHRLQILVLCQSCQAMSEREEEGVGEKVGSGDMGGREMETDEKGSPGAEVILWTRC